MLTLVFPMSLEIPGLVNKRKSRWIKDNICQCLVIGVGKESTQKVLAKWREDNSHIADPHIGENRILLLGFCGGLDPSLRAGDMVLSTHYSLDQRLSHAHLYRQCEPNLNMLFQAVNVITKKEMRWSLAPSLTTTHIVGTRVEKAKVRESCNAGTVNMEDFWVADFARQWNIPFLSVRVVVDEAAQEISSNVLELPLAPWKVLQFVLSRPNQLVRLTSLMMKMAVAKRKLSIFAGAFLASTKDQ